MDFDKITLWFAKDDSGKIITISEINNNNKDKNFNCPICDSVLKPRAINSTSVTPHFYHIDKSKCNSETMIHWWFKHKFIQEGDKFTIETKNTKEYICKEIFTERIHKVDEYKYKPDLTIVTECGETIYFELAFSNKKKIKDYIDVWLLLNNTVVEVDIKQLLKTNETPVFKPLFYEGKCINVKKNDLYHRTIGKYKENLFKKGTNNLFDQVKKLDWFWDDLVRYKKEEISIEELVISMECLNNAEFIFIKELLEKANCSNVLEEYTQEKVKRYYREIKSAVQNKFGDKFVEYVGYECKGKYGEIKYKYINSDQWRGISINEEFKKAKQRVFNCIRTNIKREKQKRELEEFNSLSSILNEILKDNPILSRFSNQHSDRGYSLNFDIKSYKANWSNEDLKIIIFVKLFLYFNNRVVSSHEIEIKELNEIDHKLSFTLNRFQNYIGSINPFGTDLIKQLENISSRLNENLSCFGLSVRGIRIAEDEYRIIVNSESKFSFILLYDIEDNSIWNLEDKIGDFSEVNEIYNKIYYDIKRKLNKLLQNECVSCGDEFKVSLGELKFFNSKNLYLPRRCKTCRKERKRN